MLHLANCGSGHAWLYGHVIDASLKALHCGQKHFHRFGDANHALTSFVLEENVESILKAHHLRFSQLSGEKYDTISPISIPENKRCLGRRVLFSLSSSQLAYKPQCHMISSSERGQ